MPIPLRIDQNPLMTEVLTLVADELSKQGKVSVNSDWIAKHGCKIENYSNFKKEFLLLISKFVRKRFIREKKSDEFAITLANRILAYTVISLGDLDDEVTFSRS
jgi:hypothetical protein